MFLGLGDAARIGPLLAALDGWAQHAGPDPWAVADQARLSAVQADRARAAETYFNANAGAWDELRTLCVADSEVEAAMAEMLAGTRLGRLVDLGTGTGRMLALFAPQAERALGIDRSPEMLRFARAKLAAAGLDQVDLRQGDLYALPLPGGCADTVLLHQVLHYAHLPEAMLREAARLLAPGGRLVVADFAPHEREELRTRHAHARLGFSDEQMEGWLSTAGLAMENSRALADGELTVKLWLGRKRPAG